MAKQNIATRYQEEEEEIEEYQEEPEFESYVENDFEYDFEEESKDEGYALGSLLEQEEDDSEYNNEEDIESPLYTTEFDFSSDLRKDYTESIEKEDENTVETEAYIEDLEDYIEEETNYSSSNIAEGITIEELLGQSQDQPQEVQKETTVILEEQAEPTNIPIREVQPKVQAQIHTQVQQEVPNQEIAKMMELVNQTVEKVDTLSKALEQKEEERAKLAKMLAEKSKADSQKSVEPIPQQQKVSLPQKPSLSLEEEKKQVSKTKPITYFIKTYGEKTATVSYRILQTDLRKYYSNQKIKRSLDMSLIIEDKEYYLVTL